MTTKVYTMNKNPVGRPPSKQESMVRHITKCYSGKEFTTADLVTSYGVHLRGGLTPANVKAGMMMKKLANKNIVKVVGEQETGTRGINHKRYKLL